MKQKTAKARINGNSVYLAMSGFVEPGTEYTITEIEGFHGEKAILVMETKPISKELMNSALEYQEQQIKNKGG